ncbi:hypothetical protein DFH07DRAFT_977424 [Mycena maculata]|uniref:Uncharacterized protein n=1 Tax=Mycena maculata TaxID=230809 RepID=A0AAD7INN0_9AGAR|nr:hypothetical protein DFH07DRAFT_977424 [Mycena maculata]
MQGQRLHGAFDEHPRGARYRPKSHTASPSMPASSTFPSRHWLREPDKRRADDTHALAAAATEARCIIRCKSIKPLRAAKRAVSPQPPMPLQVPWKDIVVPNFSRPMTMSLTMRTPPSRPPPRTPVPCDATWSGDFEFAADYVVYAPHCLSLGLPIPILVLVRPSSFPLPPHANNSDAASPASSTSTTSLASLLSPPTHKFPAEAQGVPSDVSDADKDEGEWEECDVAYDDVPLSPLVACAPSPRGSLSLSPIDSPIEQHEQAEEEVEGQGKWSFPLSPLPALPAYMGWHARPRASEEQPRNPQTPALRSRWSSSTLSSVHSLHATHGARSPKTFSFARRYFPSSSSPSSASKSPKPKVCAMGATAPSAHAYAYPKRKERKSKKPLTVADVLIVGRPAAPSVLACTSPDIFSSPSAPSPAGFSAIPLTPASALSPYPYSAGAKTPATPYSAGGQYAAYPAPASPAPSPSLSAALVQAYVTQRSPRRRASTASARSGWSYSSSSPGSSSCGGSGESDAGGSECSSGSGGLRRKPIPVEMFLR